MGNKIDRKIRRKAEKRLNKLLKNGTIEKTHRDSISLANESFEDRIQLGERVSMLDLLNETARITLDKLKTGNPLDDAIIEIEMSKINGKIAEEIVQLYEEGILS